MSWGVAGCVCNQTHLIYKQSLPVHPQEYQATQTVTKTLQGTELIFVHADYELTTMISLQNTQYVVDSDESTPISMRSRYSDHAIIPNGHLSLKDRISARASTSRAY